KGAVEKAKEALKGDDTFAINQARDELMQAFSAAGQEMYQAQAAETGASQPDMDDMGAEAPDAAQADAGGGEADEEVVEADYEIVDEEK
ncbi:MAG: molecular chaperone DnaK, partial [Gemmatimonadota bacterium]